MIKANIRKTNTMATCSISFRPCHKAMVLVRTYVGRKEFSKAFLGPETDRKRDVESVCTSVRHCQPAAGQLTRAVPKGPVPF
jgi:hypothetical protein